MIDHLKPYPAYRDSGVVWLDKIPVHWSVLPNRALFAEVNQRNHPDEEMLSVTISQGVMRQNALLANSSKKDSSNQNKSNYKLASPGDIAYNKMRAWQGAIGVSAYRGIVSPAYVIMRLRDAHSAHYFHHLFRTPHFAKEAERWSFGITSDQWSLRAEHFKMIYSVLPPPDEQAAIVRFLDHANRRIDRYIRAKRKLIALLNEQKQAIIHQAVTRGLDPNVRLKPSGIPWFRDIPEHWESLPVRRLVSVVTSGSRGWAQYYSDTGHIFLQSGNLGRSMSLNLSFIQYVDPPEGSEGIRTIVQPNDVLVCVTGALTGNVALVDVDLDAPAYVNQHVALVRPRPTAILPRYLAFALHSEVGRTQFKTNEYGGTKQGLGLEDVKSVFVPVPPISEQMAICSALDNQIAMFGTAITRTEREIALIREYRTRLVADVVTGQLDVRAAVANLPEPEVFDDEPTEDWSEAENEEVDSEALAEAEIDAK
jgi:type I restriction enzyme, S subunit